ncbi:MAG: hypothetical protein KDA24_20605 [Deltaproteobacteria bacterium]|nr:hypothetical protein [Deltaproteobacteria bacterium]
MKRLLLLLALGLAACPSTDVPDPPEPEPETITGIENAPLGDALVPEVALFPFPSDFWLEDDPTTATGRRVVFPEGVLPEPLTPETYGDHDGFSRIPTLLSFFDVSIDPTTLPPLEDAAATLSPDSSVVLLREDTWEPVPALVELDANAQFPFEQSLIIRPRLLLEAGTGYVVLITDDVKDTNGQPLPLNDAFRALRDDIATDSEAVEAWRSRFSLVTDAIAGTQITPERVRMGWSFHTRSEESVVGPLLQMQEIAGAATLPPWELVIDEVDGDDRLVRGTFMAPDFLDEDGFVRLDDGGAPIVQGERTVEFLLTIPVELEETRPVFAFGHGFFSTLEEPTWGSLNSAIHRWRMSTITTNFLAFNEGDALSTFGLLGSRLQDTYSVTSQQLQSLTHFTLLSRLVDEQLVDDPRLVTGSGDPLLLPAPRYMGISNGGTQGLTLMSTSPGYTIGALVVPGGAWSHMLERAVQWNDMGALLRERFEDPRELQAVMALVQPLLDAADSMNYAEHLTRDRFPGLPPVRVTMHEALWDSQVANMVTHWVARTAQIPLVTPAPIDVWGIPTVTAAGETPVDTESALIVYDLEVAAIPPGNVPPAEDNDTHAEVRNREDYLVHLERFLEDGTIVQQCVGACDGDDAQP